MSKFGKELIQSMAEAVEHAEGKAGTSLKFRPLSVRKPLKSNQAKSEKS